MRILRAGILVGLLLRDSSGETTPPALVTFIPGAWLVHVLLKKHALA